MDNRDFPNQFTWFGFFYARSEEFLSVENIISTIGDLYKEGYRNIIVQPTHMFFMEQSQDVKTYIDAIASIKTTKKRWHPSGSLVIGHPAQGMPGDSYDYHEDLTKVVETLKADTEAASPETLYRGAACND